MLFISCLVVPVKLWNLKMFLKWIICIHCWPALSQSHCSDDSAEMLQLFWLHTSYHVQLAAVRVEALWVHDQSDTLRHTPFSMSLCDPTTSFKPFKHTQTHILRHPHLLFHDVTNPHSKKLSTLVLTFLLISNLFDCMISHNSSAVCTLVKPLPKVFRFFCKCICSLE